ncbi:AfsR/SARP family transcriptional regulator [Nonomuraea sp. SYSU D8015]|uniref:AfsR/SARP family transcriptional regulator n=1 Tax=Nonomuraea sp. SYSU D8015 TaxID=2593644 RepID=UPI0016604BAA|nr:BTAD domain-containing putative transcriptional regulator [Nonomuraea sp. SYSU D8015]
MRFEVLGRLTVYANDQQVPLSPLKRRLVATLLLSGATGILAEDLMTALWGDSWGREGGLKTQVSELRLLLPERIPPGGAAGYRLDLLPGDSFDLHDYRALCSDAKAFTNRGDYARTAEALAGALALWGDPPLADVPDRGGKLPLARDELLIDRKGTVMALLQARLHLGQYRELLTEVRRELTDDPLSEQLHALLMTALHRGGERILALQHYEAVSALLTQETSIGPGVRLRQLRDEIAEDESRSMPANEHPRAAPHTWPPPAQLPPDVIDYTGRQDEVQSLVDYFTSAENDTGVRIASITGPGGVGKSALAVHVAHLIRHAYPDGQLYVRLEAMSERPRDVGQVLAELLGSLGVHPQELPGTPAERTALLRSLLAGRRMLLVLDDVLGIQQVNQLLPGTAGCGVIISSRMHLAEGAMLRVRLYPLSNTESLHLLGEIIGHDRIASEAEAAAALVEACDGFPLAIRVAGARLTAQPHWSLRYFADRLAELDSDEMGVAASIAADSYHALPNDARHAFRVLALAGPSDFPSWVATMLLGADAENLLETLTTHSLIAPAGTDALGQPRYRQHGLLRTFAADRLAERVAESDAVVDRLLLGWLELADLADSLIPHEPNSPPPARLSKCLYAPPLARRLIQADPQNWFASEIGNLLDVVRFACRELRVQSAVGVALRIHSYLFWARRSRNAQTMWRLIMHTALASGDERLAAEARLRLAILISRSPGGAERSMPMLNLSTEVFRSVVDRRALARSLAARAVAGERLTGRQRQEHLSQATSDAIEGLKIAQTARDVHTQVACLRTLGFILSRRGLHSEAIMRCREAVKLSETMPTGTGQKAYQAYTLWMLGRVELAAGNHDVVLDLCSRRVDLVTPLGHEAGDASFLEMEGDALMGLGRHNEAAERYAAATTQYEGEGTRHHVDRCRSKLAAAMRVTA